MLSTEDFGIIQWANATAMFITTILSLGMEQVVARRIAAAKGSDWAAAAFLLHNLVGSLLALGLVFLSQMFVSDDKMKYLPLFFAAQAIIFLVTPLKQFLNAKHMFTPYGLVSVISNSCKIILAIILIKAGGFNIEVVGYILLSCATLEFIALLTYVWTRTSFRMKFRFSAYKRLVRESMPQYMAVIFDSSLSRLDIILLGVIGTTVAMGEYGFAYRAFEVARLPIVIIAPIILNIFAKMFVNGNRLSEEKLLQIRQLYTTEIFVAMLIPLSLNILWAPLFDDFFHGKYGSSNAVEFMLLSVCIPISFFINLMWTLSFSARKYKNITTITVLSAIVNLILNVILIPVYGGIGAAVAYLLTTIFQAFMYNRIVKKEIIELPLNILFRFLLIAGLVYFTVQLLHLNIIAKLLLAAALYSAICFSIKWIRPDNFKALIRQLKE